MTHDDDEEQPPPDGELLALLERVSADKQGRILLPEAHCEWAQLDGDVVFIGSPGRMEIWSVQNYQANEPADRSALQAAADESGL